MKKTRFLLSALSALLSFVASMTISRRLDALESRGDESENGLRELKKSFYRRAETDSRAEKLLAEAKAAPLEMMKSAPPPQVAPGRIVHFVLESGAHRPAMITADLCGRTMGDAPVALTVFLALGDVKDARGPVKELLKMPVQQDDLAMTPGSWHWPETYAANSPIHFNVRRWSYD